MFEKLMSLIGVVKMMGYITNVTMSSTFASIDFHNNDTEYMLTITATKKEEKENAD